MTYDEFENLGLFDDGPAAIVAEAVVGLRFDLAESLPDAFQDAVAASLEYILAHTIQLCEMDGVPWGEVVERAKARASLERFFDDENI